MKASFRKVLSSSAPSEESNAEPPSSLRLQSLRPPASLLRSPSVAPRASGRARAAPPQTLVVPRNDGELILDYPKPLEPVTAVRSTLITSSLSALRAHGLFERYAALQTSPHRDEILSSVAGEWLSMEVVQAHYEACDALGLSEEQQIAVGKDVSRRIHETFLGLLVKAVRSAGMTPWHLLPRGTTIQHRLCKGGGLRIFKLNPKSARVELARMPHLAIPYARHGLIGLYCGGVELLARNVTARIVKTESHDPARLLVLRIDWE